jgi:hypothetical protein
MKRYCHTLTNGPKEPKAIVQYMACDGAYLGFVSEVIGLSPDGLMLIRRRQCMQTSPTGLRS